MVISTVCEVSLLLLTFSITGSNAQYPLLLSLLVFIVNITESMSGLRFLFLMFLFGQLSASQCQG